MRTFKENQKLLRPRQEYLRNNPTKYESIAIKLLQQLGERFIFQKGFLKNYFVIVDFYLPKRKLVIEIDGEYHQTRDMVKKDKRRDNYLTNNRNFKMLRINNSDIVGMSKEILLEKIHQTIQE